MKWKSHFVLWRANSNSKSNKAWFAFFSQHGIRLDVWERIDQLRLWIPEVSGRGKWISTIEIRNNKEKRIYAKTFSELKSKSKKFSQNYPHISELKMVTVKFDLECANIWK